MKAKQNDFSAQGYVFSSFLSIFFAAVYAAVRFPLPTDYLLLLKILGLILLLLFLPQFRGWPHIHFRLWHFPFFFIFSLWLAAVVWGSGYHSPLFLEGLALHTAHEDQIFQSAMAQMINTFGIPGTGLNGVPFIPYHFGSQWLILQLSKIVGTSPLIFYQIGYPVFFLPLFFFSLFLLASEVRKFYRIPLDINWRFWLIFIILFIGFSPMQIIGLLDFVIIYGESYLMSMIFLFLLLALFFHEARKKCAPSFFPLLILMPLSLILMGLLKISTMYLLFLLYLYFIFRFQSSDAKKKLLLFLLSFFSVFFIQKYITNQNYTDSLRFELFDFVRHNVTSFWKVFFFPYHFFLTIIFLYLRLHHAGIKTFTQLKTAICANKLIDAEILAIMSAAGFLPGALFHIDAGGAIYFSDVQKQLAIAFWAAWLPLFFSRGNFSSWKQKLTLNNYLLLFFLIPLTVSFYKLNYLMPVRNFLHRLNLIKNTAVKPNFAANPNWQMIKLLQVINSTPVSEKKNTLLFIPRSNKNYWNLLSCYASPFVAPALSGLAMINGVLTKDCDAIGFGYEYYSLLPAAPQKISVRELCQKVRTLGFRKLKYVSTFRLIDIKNFDCKASCIPDQDKCR